MVQSEQVRSSSILLVNNLLAAERKNSKKTVKRKINKTARRVFESFESIQESIGKLLYDKLIQAINHPTVQDNLAHLVIQVLNRDDVKMNVSKLTSDVFTSEQIITTVQKVLGDAVVSEYVKVCSIQLGRETTNAILNDSIVRKNLSGKFQILGKWPLTSRFRCPVFNYHTDILQKTSHAIGCCKN